MSWCQCELTLQEMLSDSIVQAVMEADGVDPKVLEMELRSGLRILPEHIVVTAT
jgi:hypothetical protein